MYIALTSRISKFKRKLGYHRRKRARAKQIRNQKKLVGRVFMGFVGITGIVLIWSGISRFASDALTLGESISIGVGLLFVSGLLTKRFVKMFA